MSEVNAESNTIGNFYIKTEVKRNDIKLKTSDGAAYNIHQTSIIDETNTDITSDLKQEVKEEFEGLRDVIKVEIEAAFEETNRNFDSNLMEQDLKEELKNLGSIKHEEVEIKEEITNLSNEMEGKNNKKTFVCATCGFKTASKRSIKLHVKEHRLGKRFTCNLCDYKTAHRCALKLHMSWHTGEKPFACNLCDFRTLYKCSLKSHMNTHTGEQLYYCKYKTSHKQNLTKHILIQKDEKPFASNVCDFKAASKAALKRHKLSHSEKAIACDLCNFRTAYRKNLNVHMATHTGKKPLAEQMYCCYYCKYKSSHKQNLTRHILIHKDDKPFACTVCDFTTVDKATLKYHKLSHSEKH